MNALQKHLSKAGKVKSAAKSAASRANGKRGGGMPSFAKKLYEAVDDLCEDWKALPLKANSITADDKDTYDGDFIKFIDENLELASRNLFGFRYKASYLKAVYSRFVSKNGLQNKLKAAR